MKYIFPTIAIAFTLGGCMATTDLAKINSNAISPQEQKIASDISRLVPQRCVTGQVNRTTGEFVEASSMKLSDSAIVKRLYSSSQGWYKAEAVTKGIWDNFYYKPSDGSFVCGQRLWDEYSDTRSFQFNEVGEKQKRLENLAELPASPQSMASKVGPVEAFRKTIKLTYKSDEQLCDDIKWGLKTQAYILKSISQGRDYFGSSYTGISAEADAMRMIKIGELLTLLDKQNNSNEILAQCHVDVLK